MRHLGTSIRTAACVLAAAALAASGRAPEDAGLVASVLAGCGVVLLVLAVGRLVLGPLAEAGRGARAGARGRGGLRAALDLDLDADGTMVSVRDSEGRIVAANRRFTAALGEEAGTIVGRSAWDVLRAKGLGPAELERMRQADLEALRSGRVDTRVHAYDQHSREDGREDGRRWFRTTRVPLLKRQDQGQDQGAQRLLVVSLDVTGEVETGAFFRDDSGDGALSSLAAIVASAARLSRGPCRRHGVALDVSGVPPTMAIACRPAPLTHALGVLIAAAVDGATYGPERWVKVEATSDAGTAVIRVLASGGGAGAGLRELGEDLEPIRELVEGQGGSLAVELAGAALVLTVTLPGQRAGEGTQAA